MLRLKLESGITVPLRALCDPGSQLNLISKKCANKIGLSRNRSNIRISGFDGVSTGKSKGIATVTIAARLDDKDIHTIKVIIVAELPQILPSGELSRDQDQIVYADENWHVPAPIQMLLGAGAWAAILEEGIVPMSNGLVRQSTKLGYVVFGDDLLDIEHDAMCNLTCGEESLAAAINKLWEVENIVEGKPLSASDKWCQENFLRTHKRSADGRYIVTIPINPNDNELGDSRKAALRRFFMLENRFKKDPDQALKYKEFMREYEHLGHMRPVEAHSDQGGQIYYVPHHAVTKKFRVVFDASQRTSNGKSLNDIQLTGPKLQPDLLATIMNFRAGKVAICADIKKMYRQIEVNQSQWNLQRIFWRDSPLKPLREYWLTVVTYGMTASGYNAVRALLQCAADHHQAHPRGAEIVNDCFYMDDMLVCEDSLDDAIKAKSDIVALLQKGGFELDKWVSNEPTLSGTNDATNAKSLEPEDAQGILGLRWDHISDHLMINVRMRSQPANMTKRQLASESARIFDPLRLLLPATLQAKVFIKKVWDLKIDWDDEIPAELQKEWLGYYSQLECLKTLRIPRWIGLIKDTKGQLHIFVDASNVAYGAAAYLVVKNAGKIQSNLLISSSKLAPKTTMTIPRLELCAAALGVQLLDQIKTTKLCRNVELFFWTDSEIVLYWLRKESDKMKVFVANRVSRIQRHSQVDQWNHVKSAENPADLLSRGVTGQELIDSGLWWHGPSFICDAAFVWAPWTPTVKGETVHLTEINKEMRPGAPTAICNAITYKSKKGIEIDLLTRTSSLTFLLTVTAIVMRVARNWLRKLKSRSDKGSSLLSVKVNETGLEDIIQDERDIALKFWVQRQQRSEFPSEYAAVSKQPPETGDQPPDIVKPLKKESRLKSCAPYLDEHKVMRVWGRLDNMEASHDTKHPMILDGKGYLTTLLIAHAHETLSHGTPAMIQVFLRQRFYIVGGRVAIKKYCRNCVTCVRYTGRIPTQLMGNLPAVRVNPAKAFYSTGLDYAGPFLIKKGRGRLSEKSYIAIFVCMVTKAVHLELVSDMTTVAFLAALDRFIQSRAGQVRHIYCDNGRNFVGAENELRTVIESWEGTEVAKYSAGTGIEWHFNTPLNPHAGGLWERGVQSVKSHLKRMGGATSFTHEELATLLARIALCLNSRPLSAMSDNPDDMTVLTPGHFLVGGPMVQPWAPDFSEVPENRLSAWQKLHKLQQQFWQQWKEECIVEQLRRNKWLVPQRNIKVNDMVMLRNVLTPPTTWLLGRIINVFPGKDGLVRSVEVRTEHSHFKRPIGQVCLLPVDHEIRGDEKDVLNAAVEEDNDFRD